MPEAPTWTQYRTRTVLQVRQRGGVGCLWHPGRPAARERPSRRRGPAAGPAREIGDQRRRTERRDVDAVERGSRELGPHGVVGVVVGHPTGLAKHRGSGLLPLADVVLQPDGKRREVCASVPMYSPYGPRRDATSGCEVPDLIPRSFMPVRAPGRSTHRWSSSLASSSERPVETSASERPVETATTGRQPAADVGRGQ